MSVEDFFKTYPNAPFVFQVKGQLFLPHAEMAAKQAAREVGVKAIKITKPKEKK